MIERLDYGDRDEDEGHVQAAVAADPTPDRWSAERAWDDAAINALVADQPAAVQRRLLFLFAVNRELAGITHDLRTPVTVIRLHTQLLQRHIASSARADGLQIKEGLAQIATTAAKMASLLDDLQILVRRQAGERVSLQYQPADLVTLVDQVVADHQLMTNRHQIRLVVARLPGAALVGRWDVAQLERALGNLLSNAIKYSPDGSEIVVEIGCERTARRAATDEADHAVVRIRDHGLGIPDADLAAIFEPFHRATNVAGRLPGLGIGLTTAQQIVAHHGGSIQVASKLGQGTLVTIHLPLLPAGYVRDASEIAARKEGR